VARAFNTRHFRIGNRPFALYRFIDARCLVSRPPEASLGLASSSVLWLVCEEHESILQAMPRMRMLGISSGAHGHSESRDAPSLSSAKTATLFARQSTLGLCWIMVLPCTLRRVVACEANRRRQRRPVHANEGGRLPNQAWRPCTSRSTRWRLSEHATCKQKRSTHSWKGYNDFALDPHSSGSRPPLAQLAHSCSLPPQ
jgi:hypothetical protein